MSAEAPWLSATASGVIVAVKAVPRARRTRAVGIQDGHVRIQIAAPPHDGRSNAALCAYLAAAGGVRPSAARVRRGSSGARKLVEMDGDAALLAERLMESFSGLETA